MPLSLPDWPAAAAEAVFALSVRITPGGCYEYVSVKSIQYYFSKITVFVNEILYIFLNFGFYDEIGG
jgi:hypothetical protein